MPLELVTPAAVAVVSIAEARDQLRDPPIEDNARIGRMISAATVHTESMLRRSLMSQVWRYSVDCFPAYDLELPRGRLLQIESVKYDDAAGAEQTLDAAVYEEDRRYEPGRIRLAEGQSWPATNGRPNAVRIEFMCGYGAQPTDVPEPLRQSLLMQVESLYDCGEMMQEGKSAAWALALPYRLGVPIPPTRAWGQRRGSGEYRDAYGY